MKTTRNLAIVAITVMLCSCGAKQSEHKCIAPMPAGIDVENLQDCIVPATFTSDDFNWMGGNLTMMVSNKDLYDAVEVSQMQVGDTIIYDGNPIVIEKVEETHGGVAINGGQIDEGGCSLIANEGGTYVANHWDTHATYTNIGKAQVPLAEDFIIIDCGEDFKDPSDTISTGQKLYIENLQGSKREFFSLNTLVAIERGQITQIIRRWIP